MAGIVHYSNFFRYMETAEHGFFRLLGYSVVMNHFEPPVGWPRVHAECDYRQPLRFEDEVEIHMLVSEKKSKSLSYVFKFRKLNGPEPLEVARGSLTVVCVTKQPELAKWPPRISPRNSPIKLKSPRRNCSSKRK